MLLGGVMMLTILTSLVTFYYDIRGLEPQAIFIYQSALFVLPGIILIFLINRFWSGTLASSIFLLLLTLVLTADEPQQVVGGRTLFMFAIPILMASVLIRSYASFIMAGIVGMVISFIALTAELVPNFVGILAFFAIALVSWLSSRNLEQALRELRAINTELDQRVAERTKELSEALTRESEQASQRQAILQGIADGVVVFDNTGKAILANPALSRLVEIPFDQIVSRKASEIFNSSGVTQEDRDALLKILTTDSSNSVPRRIRWGQKTLSIGAAPVRDNKNDSIGIVAVFRDFTREAEVEEMKNSFVAMVSHELRTPLNAILGYSEMLRDAYYGPMNDKQANAADRILNNSRRLLDIVSDLLDKAQIEAGHLSLNISAFRTTELTENLHSVMDKIAGDKGLALTADIEPEMPEELQADSQRIQQIMVNLVNNAVKFTETGGINVHIYKVADEYWAFDVTDTGPGITPEDQRIIFDPFRQVGKTATRLHGGIGLGLSIVKRLVDLMRGRIFLKSIVGKGSTFTVILPFSPPQKGNQE